MGRSRGFHAGLTALLGAVVVGTAAQAGAPDPALRLPDLVQEAPADVTIAPIAGRWLLGFRSAVANEGDGPLAIESNRASRRTPAMVADQLIERGRGSGASRSPLRRRGVGVTRFVRDVDHRHWHLEDFERYELRTPAGAFVVDDRKTGFCLGDRYATASRLARSPKYERNCGLDRPDLLRVREGISPGFGDDYAAYLEGQSIDITGVQPGVYVLVHRVNPDGRLLESRMDNNVACLGVELGLPTTTNPEVPALRTFAAACPPPAPAPAPG